MSGDLVLLEIAALPTRRGAAAAAASYVPAHRATTVSLVEVLRSP